MTHLVQTELAIQAATDSNRSTILQAFGTGPFGEAAYKSGDTWLQAVESAS